MSKINFDSIGRNFANADNLQKIIELNQNKEDLTKAIKGTTASRYKDLAELQDSGNSVLYNQAKHDVVMKEVYSTVAISVKSVLNRQDLALKNITGIIDKFNVDMIEVKKNMPDVPTKAQVCDKALAAIAGILNTQDADGKYLFGGVSASVKPCVDLTAFSNLDSAGNILNNYTTAAPNVKSTDIADGMSIEVGIDASNPAFATLIGAFNKIKYSPNAVPTDAELVTLANDLNTGMAGIEVMQGEIITNNEALKEADLRTKAKEEQAVTLLASNKFTIPADELVQNLLEYMKSLKVLQSVQTINFKTSNHLVDMIASAA